MPSAPLAARALSAPALAAAMAAALAAPGLASAAQFQMGAAGGISRYDDRCEGVSRCDTSDRASKAHIGLRFDSGLVLEAVWMDFGRLRGSGAGVDVALRTTAAGGGLAWYAPVAPFTEFFVRAGLAQVKARASASGFADAESHAAVYGGLGLAWQVAPALSVQLAWDATTLRYGDAREAVAAGTVGLSLRF